MNRRNAILVLTLVLMLPVILEGRDSGPSSVSSVLGQESPRIRPSLAGWSIASRIQGNLQAASWADSVMRNMSLKERIAQLLVYTVAPDRSKANLRLLDQVVTDYGVGGLLFSGGHLEDQAILTNRAQEKARVPLMICFDGEWGPGMRLKDTPSFPRNRVLGAITKDSLLRTYGLEVARELRQIGVSVNFAPVADVDNNPGNPVINTRSFGEQPWNVADKVISYSRGLEEGGVLAVLKHFPGHGDTETDSHKSLPRLSFTRERLDSVELRPFREAVRAGVSGVMVGHLDVPALSGNSSQAASLSPEIATDVLRGQLGFQGLSFTDALVMGGLSGTGSVTLQALKAGNDMLLVPPGLKNELNSILEAVKRKEITEDLINKKCRKVLMYKYVLGLSHPSGIQLSGLSQRVGRDEAYELIDDLYRASTILLKNEKAVLPFREEEPRVAVLSLGATREQLTPLMEGLGKASDFFLLTSDRTQWPRLLEKVGGYGHILIVAASSPSWDFGAFIPRIGGKVPVTALFLTSLGDARKCPSALEEAQAVLLAHSSGAAQQRFVAGVLSGRGEVSGRLPISLGGAFPAGSGLDFPYRIPSPAAQARANDIQFNLYPALSSLDSIALDGIRQGAFPGCQIVVIHDRLLVYAKNFGYQTYGDTTRVVMTDLYDLASMTKTTATLLAVMRLYDQGRLNLTDRASKYLEYLRNTPKKNITLRDLLLHESGLPSSISFYLEAVDQDSYPGHLISSHRDALHRVQTGQRAWANPSFSFKEGLTSPQRTPRHTLEVARGLWIDSTFRQEYHRRILEAPLRAKRYVYSDLNFILLQEIVERVSGMTLDCYVDSVFYQPMGLERTLFKPLERIPQEEIVPTANDRFLRKQLLRGYVHDEAAAFLGGVSGNAGLFSTAYEVAQIYQMLLDGGQFAGRRYLGESTVNLFTTVRSKISRRGLGFDRPDTENPQKSPCAPSAPASCFGHTGFTGTCVWTDPTNRIVMVFLSNRVHPDSWNPLLSTLDIRCRLHQAVYDAIVGP